MISKGHVTRRFAAASVYRPHSQAVLRMHAKHVIILTALALISVSTVSADKLRNIRRGQQMPTFSAAGLDGEPVSSADAAGTVRVLVYLSAQQKRSEQAFASAHRVVKKIGGGELKLIYMSGAVDQADYFKRLRDRLEAREPFALDEGRAHYGRLGLIVCPTTIITAKDGRLLHVISSWTRDYEHRLEACCRHALGEFDEAELAKRLTVKPRAKDDARARADRRRAVAAVLRAKGQTDAAIKELEQALAADPACAGAAADLAELLVVQGKLDEAEKCIAELLARQPGHLGGKLMLGLVKLKREQFDEAEKLLNETLTSSPDPVRAHYYLGQLHEQKGDYKLAMEHYRNALEHYMKER